MIRREGGSGSQILGAGTGVPLSLPVPSLQLIIWAQRLDRDDEKIRNIRMLSVPCGQHMIASPITIMNKPWQLPKYPGPLRTGDAYRRSRTPGGTWYPDAFIEPHCLKVPISVARRRECGLPTLATPELLRYPPWLRYQKTIYLRSASGADRQLSDWQSEPSVSRASSQVNGKTRDVASHQHGMDKTE